MEMIDGTHITTTAVLQMKALPIQMPRLSSTSVCRQQGTITLQWTADGRCQIEPIMGHSHGTPRDSLAGIPLLATLFMDWVSGLAFILMAASGCV